MEIFQTDSDGKTEPHPGKNAPDPCAFSPRPGVPIYTSSGCSLSLSECDHGNASFHNWQRLRRDDYFGYRR